MIDIHELRIGNYILVDDTLTKVCALQCGDIKFGTASLGFKKDEEVEFETADSRRVKGVPLTDRLLTQLGFKFHIYYKLWQHAKPERTATIELSSDYTAIDFSHRPMLKHIKYVHLLQNLFYSLQGGELDFVKLPKHFGS
jgi:hypothetical protein